MSDAEDRRDRFESRLISTILCGLAPELFVGLTAEKEAEAYEASVEIIGLIGKYDLRTAILSTAEALIRLLIFYGRMRERAIERTESGTADDAGETRSNYILVYRSGAHKDMN